MALQHLTYGALRRLAPGLSAGAVCAFGLHAAAQHVDAPIKVPSGQAVTLIEVITDERGPAGLTYRFRFAAPGISREDGAVPFEDAALDMDHLCREYAIPRIPTIGPQPSQIIISLSDKIIEFGMLDPGATQFFEAYRAENGDCIWEGF